MSTLNFLSRIMAIATILLMTFGSTQPVYAAPDNDNFANATLIESLPFDVEIDTTGATLEANEPYPECAYGYPVDTVWYAYTPSESTTLSVYMWNGLVAIYTGSTLDNLALVLCSTTYWDPEPFWAEAGVTYYFQLSHQYGEEGSIRFELFRTPPPQIGIDVWPENPSIYDVVRFGPYIGYDPGGIYEGTCLWMLWDGTTRTDYYFDHQFTTDGNYPLSLVYTTTDGRVAESSMAVNVRTHDIAITKFSIPLIARINQTKEITVEITNKRYPEEVEVYLFKGLPGGSYQLIGYLTMQVPARPNRPTLFKFSYNFTAADAAIGNVTLRAEANIIYARDALPTDNIAIRTVLVK